MRRLALALLVATPAVAQSADLAALDRRVAALDAEIAGLSAELSAIRAELAAYGGDGTGIVAERARYDAAYADYERDMDAHAYQARRVAAMYDLIAEGRASPATRRVYDRARFALADDAERLEGEAAMLAEWARDFDRTAYAHSDAVRALASRGQRIGERRAALGHERWVLAARRDRLRARR